MLKYSPLELLLGEKWFKLLGTLKSLVWITQLGLSIISPLLICVLGAAWLRGRFGWGTWVIILGLLLGLGGAVCAGATFCRHTRPLTQGDTHTKKPPVSFNDHD